MKKEKVVGGLVGVCVGDALGVPGEFVSRDKLKLNPIKDMVGYGTYNQPPGTWSDDSSLTLCLAESLCKGFNIHDIADKFIKWLFEGYWTPYDETFDVGNTTYIAISRLKSGIDPLDAGPKDEFSNGNGSLMRILPLSFYVEKMNKEEQFEKSHKVSRLTHGHLRSQMACGIYIQIAVNLLKGNSPEVAYEKAKEISLDYYSSEPYLHELRHFDRILKSDIRKLPLDLIKSTGYVIDTLEAALWSFLNSKTFRDAVLTAVNLGGDTDTIGAVAGGLAGIYYGYSAIPKDWVKKITKVDEIIELSERLFKAIYIQD